MHQILLNIVAMTAALVMVDLMRNVRDGSRSRRIDRAVEHFEAAADAHDAFIAKVRKDAARTLGLLREATYAAQTEAGLREDLRVDREVPREIADMPTLRPRTPAQRAKAKRADRAGNKGTRG